MKKSKYMSANSGKEDDPSKEIMSLEGVEFAKYLGSEVRTSPNLVYQDKFAENMVLKSSRYKKSIMSLANGSADPVLFAARLWESCAVPSILYSCESLLVRINELNVRVRAIIIGKVHTPGTPFFVKLQMSNFRPGAMVMLMSLRMVA